MLDLFSGLGGASQAMKDRGWRVIRVDNNPRLPVDILADVQALPLRPFPLDLLWASPPCLEYSRRDQPWFKNAPDPDLTLYHVARAVIAEWQPRWWVIENVRGAIRYWGKPARHVGSHFIWTNLPLLLPVAVERHHKYGPHDPQLRAKIPYAFSEALALTVEELSTPG